MSGKKDYNDTINLPNTEFPMRASLPVREPGFLQEWQDKDLYHQLLEKNAGKPKYVLHDGPPFSNNNIHMGTAMNKVLKDFVNRHKMMTGYNVPYVPGWDNHGMPIESAIIKQQKLDRETMPIAEFRDKCKDFAMHFVDVQRNQFVRLGVLGDWENPYLTMDPRFEAEEVRVFGAMYKKGYIYKGLKPVYWCGHDETALAEAEVEYQEELNNSVYVRFQVKDDLGKLKGYGELDKMYVIIWTTTVWTLPGNLAIAFHPEESYVLAKVGTGETYIVAEALLENVMKIAGITQYEVVATLPGKEFEYMKASHPFMGRESLMVVADYVTMTSGTGCVHTAPGYGHEDYDTGKKYGLEILVTVDDKGVMNEKAGQFSGLSCDAANKVITEAMQKDGSLVAIERITHTYPHCWRCKKPLLLRATSQWFCSVDAFKEEAVKAAREVEWVPAWGEERMVSMIVDRADWCISRQRHWGLPIPVFYCKDCGENVCDDRTIDAVANLFGKEGSNAWYLKEAEEILPQGYTCPKCGGKHFTKDTNTLDGWFDSGASHMASLELDNPDEWPCDLYLEGADQFRGWFQSALLTAVASKGGGAPYKKVLTHGWTVDGEGKAMHKSIGNTIDPLDVVKKYGGDLIRLWVASSDYHNDVRVSDAIFGQLSQAYLKMRNTSRYILGNLYGFDPNNLVAPDDMQEIDRWAISRLHQLVETCMKAYERFEYHIVYHNIYDFCVIDMSNFYLDVLKDRLYCEEKDGLLRRSGQSAMFIILDALTRLLAPIISFTAHEIWQMMPHRACDDAENVMFNQIMLPDAAYLLSEDKMEKWQRLHNLRDDVNVVLEGERGKKNIGKSLEAQVTLSCETDEALNELSHELELLKTIFIVSGVTVKKGTEGEKAERYSGVYIQAQKAEGEKCERCWAFCESVGSHSAHPTLCDRCASVVEKL